MTKIANESSYIPVPGQKTAPKDLIAHSYLLRITPIACSCGAMHSNLETFKVYIHPTLTRTTGMRHLVPITEAKADLPIGHTTLLPRSVAFCPSCVNTLSNNEVPLPKLMTDESWAAALKAEAKRMVQAPSTPKPVVKAKSASEIDF